MLGRILFFPPFIILFLSHIFPHETSRHQSNNANNALHFLISPQWIQITNLSWKWKKGKLMMNIGLAQGQVQTCTSLPVGILVWAIITFRDFCDIITGRGRKQGKTSTREKHILSTHYGVVPLLGAHICDLFGPLQQVL